MARAGGGGAAAAAPERAGGAARPEPWELSLEEVLKVYEQPINEEQAWAVCFQGCRGLRGEPGGVRRIRDTADILLRRDGSVGARLEPGKAQWGGWGCGRRGGRAGGRPLRASGARCRGLDLSLISVKIALCGTQKAPPCPLNLGLLVSSST